MRIAMSILVRDEADIIEANIRHHAKLGVSRFIVTDNSSVDGTRQILNKLSREYDLTIIDEPAKTIDQDLWVTRMAEVLKEEQSADWVINNDADEFWLAPEHSSLAKAVQSELDACDDANLIGVIYCPRFNMVTAQEVVTGKEYQFSNNHFKVVTDWKNAAADLNIDTTSDNAAALLGDGQHVIIRTLSGKVITRLEGLESVAMGNHSAKHALQQLDARCLEIAHYPIRTFEQFQRKVVNYGSAIKNNDRFGPQISLHLRLWYESEQQGNLRQVYDSIVLPESTLQALVEQGVLAKQSDLV